jgi:hypothetical protein
MIVANCFASCLLNLLLRVHFWADHMQKEDFQTRVIFHYLFKRGTAMPICLILKEQNRNIRIMVQKFIHMLGCYISIHHWLIHNSLLTRHQIQCSIKTSFFSPWCAMHYGCLSKRLSNRGGCMQIQSSFVPSFAAFVTYQFQCYCSNLRGLSVFRYGSY